MLIIVLLKILGINSLNITNVIYYLTPFLLSDCEAGERTPLQHQIKTFTPWK